MSTRHIILGLFWLILGGSAMAQTVYTWNGGSGVWSNSSAWSPPSVPGGADTAVVPSGSTITLDSDITVGGLVLDGGTLLGTGKLTIGGKMEWLDGALSGTATDSVIIPVHAQLLLSGSKLKELQGRTLSLRGTAIWSGTQDIQLGGNARLINETSGNFLIQTDANMAGANTGGTFLNRGTITKSATSGTTQFEILLDQQGTLQVNSGEVRLQSSSVNTNAAFACAANATLRFSNGNHAFNGVNFGGSGQVLWVDAVVTLVGNGLTIDAGARLVMSGSASRFQVNAPFTNNGTFDWSRGTIDGSGAIVNHGEFVISGNSNKVLDGQTIDNRQTLNWSGTGDIRLQNNARIINQSGATFTVLDDAQLDFLDPDGGSVTNAGTFRKVNGIATDATNIDVQWNHTGTVEVTGGNLQFQRASQFDAGSVDIAPASKLIIKSGTHEFGPATSLNLPGTLQIDGGATNLRGPLSGAPVVQINNGEIYFYTTVTLAALNQVKGVLGAIGNVRVNGLFNWLRGTITGSGGVTAVGELLMSGGDSDLKIIDGGSLINHNRATWSGTGNLRMGGGGIFLNPAGAIFDIKTNGNLETLTGGGTLKNYGIITKFSGFGDTNVQVFLENYHTIRLRGNSLKFFQGSRVQEGIFQTDGILEFSGGTHQWSNVTLTGSGEADFDNVDLIITGAGGLLIDAPTTAVLRGSASKFRGSGPVTVNGTMNWDRGVISGQGDLIIRNQFNIVGDNNRLLDGRRLTNYGTLRWSMTGGKFQMTNQAEILNQRDAVFEMNTRSSLEWIEPGGGTITNHGVTRKIAGSGIASFGANLVNFGVMEVQDTLVFTRTLTNHPFAALRGRGVADIALATFNNNGIIAPGSSPGILKIVGGYPESPGARVDIELGGTVPDSGYDRLEVSGFLLLNGTTLNLSLVNGYVPAPGDTLEILRFGIRNGVFSSITGLNNSTFTPLYTANSLKLTNFNFPLNNAPVAQNDLVTTDEDVPVLIDVLANDSDPDGNPLIINSFTLPAAGMLSLTPENKLRYAPQTHFAGPDTFHYTISDGFGGIATAEVFISVNPINDLPVISPRLPDVAFNLDTTFVLDLDDYASDADHSKAQLTWRADVLPGGLVRPGATGGNRPETHPKHPALHAQGKLAVATAPGTSPAGSDLQIQIDSTTHVATFSATPGSFGVFAVMFTLTDPEGGTARDTISVSVRSNAPVLLAPLPDVTFEEDSGPVTLVADLNTLFSDPDGDPLRFSTSADPGITPRIEVNSLVLDTQKHFAGSGYVTVTASDPSGAATSDLFFATFTPVPDPPDLTDFPGFIKFWKDSTVLLNVWQLVEDPESPDELVSYQFDASNDSLLRQYNPADGMLALSSLGGFVGDVTMTVTATDPGGLSASKNVTVRITLFNSIEEQPGKQLPTRFELSQNYPNPFNPETRIRFAVPGATHVRLLIYDILGRKVRSLVDRRIQPGTYEATWDGRDEWGNLLSSGLYFYDFRAGDFRQFRKMILMK